MRIVEGAGVCPFLRTRDWVKRGRIWRALRPLLGNGLLLAEGSEHVRQRAAIGNALDRIPPELVEAAVLDYSLPPVGSTVELSDVMLDLVESVVQRVLFNGGHTAAGAAIRGWLRLFPLRLLGLPVGWGHIRKLNRTLAALPRPGWMPEDLTPEEVRDQLATLYVASVETTAAYLTWSLTGHRNTPIHFVPRQHIETGENAIVLLSNETAFGHGHRHCIGEKFARLMVASITRRMTVGSRWLPMRLDMRPKFGLTRWPKRVQIQRVE